MWSDTQVTLLHRAGYQSQCLLSVCDLQSERWLCKLICLAVVYTLCVCVCVWGPSHAALLPVQPMTQQKWSQSSPTDLPVAAEPRGTHPKGQSGAQRNLCSLAVSDFTSIFWTFLFLSVRFFSLHSFPSPSILGTSCFFGKLSVRRKPARCRAKISL